MLRFILSALLVATTSAQTVEYRCDCGWFADSQVADIYLGSRQPSPLYGNFTYVDPYVCTVPVGGVNECRTWCEDWADEILADGFNLCRDTPFEDNPRCYGGFFCENLYVEGFDNIQDESVSLFFRIVDCAEDTRYTEWKPACRVLDRALCCNGGVYENCYGTGCECYRGDTENFCECGVFIDEQFVVNGQAALPLGYSGFFTNDDPAIYCEVWDVNGTECRQNCTQTGFNHFFSYRLTNETFPGGPTYGQLYCDFLQTRIAFEVAIESELSAYNRAPDCDKEDGTPVDWLKTIASHPETLCCSAEGEHVYPCITQVIDNIAN